MYDDSKGKIQDEERDSIQDGAFQSDEDTRHKPISIQKYLASRLISLKPPMNSVANPFTLLAMLNAQQWGFLAVSFLAWSWDSFDYFTVSLTVSDLAKTFGTSTSDITWGITLVLMFRSVGSIMFGIVADRYGRKWPFIINLVLFIVLELGTSFCQTYQQFLAVRALYGIAMGGMYGVAAVTALEDCPKEARGLIAGLMQQGYAFGYLLATALARALVNTTSHGWRPYFWFGAAFPVVIVAFRLCLPETKAFRDRQASREGHGHVAAQFISDARAALKHHWLLLIYMVLLTSGLNFVSHGSQDLYPTMLEDDFGFSTNAVTVTQVVANLGAMTGGTTVGYCSQIFGRRFSMIVICIIGGALIYPYTYTRTHAVTAVAFFEQFCVQGAWSVIPIYILELSPTAFQAFVVGSAYQFGNLASSASSTIEATIGERFPLPPLTEADGTVVHRYHYGKVICILTGAAYAYSILLLLLGPEKKGRVAGTEESAEV